MLLRAIRAKRYGIRDPDVGIGGYRSGMHLSHAKVGASEDCVITHGSMPASRAHRQHSQIIVAIAPLCVGVNVSSG